MNGTNKNRMTADCAIVHSKLRPGRYPPDFPFNVLFSTPGFLLNDLKNVLKALGAQPAEERRRLCGVRRRPPQPALREFAATFR